MDSLKFYFFSLLFLCFCIDIETTPPFIYVNAGDLNLSSRYWRAITLTHWAIFLAIKKLKI